VTAGIFIWLCVFTFTSDRLTLHDVTVQGCVNSDAQHLAAIIRENFPAQMLRIDLEAVRDRLEREPWVRTAELRRVLPSSLVVYISERRPAVVLELKGEMMNADEDGVLLDRYDSKTGRLDVPVFRGLLGDNPEGYRMYQQENANRVRMGQKLLSDVESGASQISEVDVSDKSNLKFLLVDEPPEIMIGDRDFGKRFQRLMANMAQYREIKNQYHEIISIDLRNEGQIVFRTQQTQVSEVQP